MGLMFFPSLSLSLSLSLSVLLPLSLKSINIYTYEDLKILRKVKQFLTFLFLPNFQSQGSIKYGKDDGHLVQRHTEINAFFISYFHLPKGLGLYRDKNLEEKNAFY